MKFVQLPLQRQKILDRLENDNTFYKCFTTDITKAFWEELGKRSHVILVLWGETGTFKSSSAIEILRRKDPTFGFDHISFFNQQLIDMVGKSTKGQGFMRDETPHDFGQGSHRAILQVGTLSETLRKRKNSLVFISPKLQNISTAHYTLYTIDATMTEDELMRRLKSGEKIEKVHVRVGVQDPRTNRFLGSLIIDVNVNNDIWLEYDKKKDVAMEGFATMEYGQIDFGEIAKGCLDELDLSKHPRKGERHVWLKQRFKNKFTSAEIKDIYTSMEQIIREEGLMDNI